MTLVAWVWLDMCLPMSQTSSWNVKNRLGDTQGSPRASLAVMISVQPPQPVCRGQEESTASALSLDPGMPRQGTALWESWMLCGGYR